jgi:hypothetical protein
MRIMLQASVSVVLEAYAVSEASVAAIVYQLLLRELEGDPPIHREAAIDSATGILSIGAPSGPAWRYLPEGYGPPTATAEALQQLADDLQALRDISATDEDLAAEVADLQDAIDAVIASGATDSELSAALAPIQSAVSGLTSQDAATATAIAAIQASIAGLDSTYATDQQLAQAVAQLQGAINTISLTPGPAGATGPQGPIGLTGPVAPQPTRSTTPPAGSTEGSEWIQLSAGGDEIIAWRRSGAEWISPIQRFVLYGRCSGSSNDHRYGLPVINGATIQIVGVRHDWQTAQNNPTSTWGISLYRSETLSGGTNVTPTTSLTYGGGVNASGSVSAAISAYTQFNTGSVMPIWRQTVRSAGSGSIDINTTIEYRYIRAA